MNKLYRIRLHEKDQVRGNYILVTSGPVQHVHHTYGFEITHEYIVDRDQIKLLEDADIEVVYVPVSDTSGLINIKNRSGETAKNA